MPSLDNPLITLGALAVAGSSRRGRQFTGGESAMGLLAGGWANASAPWFGTQLRQLTGQTGTDATLTDPLAQAIVGAGLSWADMVPANKALARGIHYNVAANAFSSQQLDATNILPDLSGSLSGDTTTSQVTSPVRTAPARTRRSGGIKF